MAISPTNYQAIKPKIVSSEHCQPREFNKAGRLILPRGLFVRVVRTRSFYAALIFLAIQFWLATRATLAQDESAQFFENDYASGVAAIADATSQSAPEKKDPRSRRNAPPSKLNGKPAVSTALVDSSQKISAVEGNLTLYVRPPAILVVVSSKDQMHLERVIRKVLSYQDRGIAHFISINHLGDYRTLSPELKHKLKDGGLNYIAEEAPPFGLPITRSPAWVFLSPAGFRIVEGTFDLDRFITPLGQYKDPKWVDISADSKKNDPVF